MASNMKNIFPFFILIVLTGCINLKDEYPEITYYTLKQEPNTLQFGDTLNYCLQIRDFTISDAYSSEHIFANLDKGIVDRYYYHRWQTDFNDMATDFLTLRFNTVNLFRLGVVSSGSLAMPDYILEGQILEIFAKTSDSKETGANYVNLIIKINLLERTTTTADLPIALTKVYEQKIQRQSNSIASIPEAYGKALSFIADRMLADIYAAIDKSRIEKQSALAPTENR